MSKIERVDKALEDVASGGTRDSELNEYEKKLFDEYVGRIRNGQVDCDIDLWRFDYIKPPPDIRTFILDDYFLGRSLRSVPGENEGIWPGWLDIFTRDFDLDSYIHNLVITGSLGAGKCWSADDKLVLFNGELKRAADIRTGDVLLGPDSTPRTVTSTTQGRGKMYQIWPVKGEPFTVNGDHILVLKSTVSDEVTEVSVDKFLSWPIEKRHKACLFRVGVDWPTNDVPIDPYVLGLWLGDGHTHQTALTTADAEIAEAWISYGQSLGLSHTRYPAGKDNKADTIQLSYRDESGTIRKGLNKLRNKFQSLGLMSNSADIDKFIPRVYLVNDRPTRLAVLAGLIDTDGSVASTGQGCFEITSKLEGLSEDIVFLARSLGYYVTTKIKVVNATAYYRVHISGALDIPVRLSRKDRRGQPKIKKSNLTGTVVKSDHARTRFAVIPKGDGDYYGFTLTGDGQCLMSDFTVTHNTFGMVILILYRICIATHLKNPQNFFGLSRGSRIIYNFLSVTKEAVRDTAFGDAMNFMGSSPYFLEVCKYDPELDYSGFRIPMLNQLPDGRTSDIWMTAGSKGQHILGRNVVGVGLDEGNFRLEKDPDLKAYVLYDAVRTRIANRFQKLSTFLPALSVIASSAADESSFTEKVIREIDEQNRNREIDLLRDPNRHIPVTQTVYRNAVYRIKRHALQDIGPDHHWFKVAYGLKNMEPFILSGWYKESGEPIGADTHEEPPSGAKTELIPKFYYEAFRRNCRTNLQALSGISVTGAHRLFPSMVDIEWCIAESERTGVPNNTKPGVERIALSTEDALNIWDHVVHRNFVQRVSSRYMPLRHPDRLRYAHIDLATQNLAGLAVCHLVGTQLVTGLVRDGEPFDEYRLIVEYDFILTICAGQSKPISLQKIQNFIFWLKDMCGYRFGKVTADMFQSASLLQALDAKGIPTDNLSLDRDKSVYLSWRSGFEERRIRLARNLQMIREAEDLLEMDKKFDHPPDGCFTGDTHVKLLNGTTISLEDMAKRGGNFWVYGNDGTGKVIPVRAYNPRKTKTVDCVLEITLDNGESVKCTPDHKFMLRHGDYARADSLKPGSSLMPLYTRKVRFKYKKGRAFYEQVHSEGEWQFTHKLVARHFEFDSTKGETVIHHRDLNPANNDPDNLERLTIADHTLRHAQISEVIRRPDIVAKRIRTFKERYGKKSASPERAAFLAKTRENGKKIYARLTVEQKKRLIESTQTAEASERTRTRNLKKFENAEYRARNAERLRRYAQSDEGRRTSALTAATTNSDPKNWTDNRKEKHTANVKAARAAGIRRRDQNLLERLGIAVDYVLSAYHAISLTKTGGPAAWKRRLKEANVDFAANAENYRGMPISEMERISGISERSLRAYFSSLGKADILEFNNHKVASVREVRGNFDVYDLSVDSVYENFALACGISVHNSKDTTDSAAGAYFGAITSEETSVLSSINDPIIETSKRYSRTEDKTQVISVALPAKSTLRTKQFQA